MSTRRSGRAKAQVKYTSASEGSDFEDKKPRKSANKKTTGAATPKKRTKAEQDPVPSADAEPTPKKRTKKDPETLAAEHTSKAAQQTAKAEKASHKKAWENWVSAHDVEGALLDEEPSKDESITQTDCAKKYSLKAGELGSLKHFEKKNPAYGNTMKLFVEEEVKVLAFRKAGMLDGAEGDEGDVLARGEEVWKKKEEHNDNSSENKDGKEKSTKKAEKPKTSKQKWTAYIESRARSPPDTLEEEPERSINQSDSRSKYSLMPADLAVLSHFPKPNPKYGNTTKLFNEDEVRSLAYRKSAVVGGVEEEDEEKLLERGEEMWREQHEGEEEGEE